MAYTARNVTDLMQRELTTVLYLQDTVIGLQALSEFAPLVFSTDIDFTVKISTGDFSKSFNVDKNNMIILQRVEVQTLDIYFDAFAHPRSNYCRFILSLASNS